MVFSTADAYGRNDMTRFRWPVAVSLLLFAATAVAAGDDAEGSSIAETRAQFNDAIARHDVQAITSFLDEDYQITTSLGQLMQGRDEQGPSWQELFDTRAGVTYVRTPETIEVSQDYPLAAESGTWLGTWSTKEGEVRTGGRYAAMWRKVDGHWRVRSELFVALYCDGVACP